MNGPFTYRTITQPSEGIYSDKGSKFMGYAFPIKDEEAFKLILRKIKSEHTGARHFCYAYRIGESNTKDRSNDDGEPSGTAGKPILNQLLSSGVSQTGIIVVRYFGGTLLGTSGLIQAYKEAARGALNAAIIIEKEITFNRNIIVSYAMYNDFMALVKKHAMVAELTHSTDNESHFRLEVPVRIEKNVSDELNNLHIV